MPRLALIQYLDGSDGPVDPGYGVGSPSPGYPTGGPVLPPGGVTLPVYPFDPTLPDNKPPSGGSIDNGLPVPGKRYVVKYLACKGLILVPDNSLPETPEPK